MTIVTQFLGNRFYNVLKIQFGALLSCAESSHDFPLGSQETSPELVKVVNTFSCPRFWLNAL